MKTSRQAYTLDFEERPRYCYGRLTAGTLAVEDADRYLSELAEKCTKLGTHGLLIERRIEGHLTRVLAYYKVGRMIDTFPTGTNVAIVDRDAGSRECFEWAIRRSSPHTLKIKVFATVAEAETWLVSNGPGTGDAGNARPGSPSGKIKPSIWYKKPRDKQKLSHLTPYAYRRPACNFTSH
jgi:hypothetical protein